MNRLLTRRDKNGQHKRSRSSEPPKASGHGILALFKPDATKRPAIDSKEDETAKKIQIVKQKLEADKIPPVDDQQIEYALQTKYADGDPEKAYEITVLFLESVEGTVRPYNPDVYMKGAENRAAVTCYLDSLLFAMFARLGSFEPILYTTFDDEPRRRLATLIRLWVNMLRSGKLIQTDITKHLQEALASCGWDDAARLEQQDTSEAFSFITEKLELPLLTLEMDIYHEGKLDDKDDHKFVKERLLEVAIPANPEDGRPIRLEDCLEEHFNARVDVVRRLERRDTLYRSNTRSSVVSGLSAVDEKGGMSDHIEHVSTESAEKAGTVGETTCRTDATEGEDVETSSYIVSPTTPTAPALRHRATSIIRHRVINEEVSGDGSTTDTQSTRGPLGTRKASIRKEVLMPAWQFFRIIPWYTTNIPTSDSQVAAHFSSTRPVLGICLKRYAMDAKGKPVRQNTPIDIPLQIALPHFIQDDKAEDGGPLFGNFNLVLQSVVCHRGNSVHSGHYISLIRGGSQTRDQMPVADDGASDVPPEYAEDKWIKFDDLASERVSYVDIEKAMVEEMPYLLFYQVRPLFDDEPNCMDSHNRPPSYEDSATDSGIGMVIREPSPVDGTVTDANVPAQNQGGYFDSTVANGHEAGNDEPAKARVSFSDDVERPRKSLTLSDRDRRGSIPFTDASTASIFSSPSNPVTPADEYAPSTAGRLSRAASRFTRSSKSKSRPTSVADENRTSLENRFSASFTRLNLMRSKEPLNRTTEPAFPDVNITVTSCDTPLGGSKPPSIHDGTSERDFEPSAKADRGNSLNNAVDRQNTSTITAERSNSAVSTLSNVSATGPAVTVASVAASLMAANGSVGRGKTQKKKEKEKEKGKSTSEDEKEHHHHHHHHHSKSSINLGKGRAKDGSEQDRECAVM